MAKIPFDIKYRPQIENGEYRVETEGGFPATILDWSFRKYSGPPYICVKITRDGTDDAFLYSEDGKRATHRVKDNDLIIITPESEDERIMKNCIHFLELQKSHHADTQEIDECIVYIEKQKEQKPVPDKFSGLKSLMLQYLQSAANRKDDAEIESDTDLFGRKILDYVWKQDEKQKEQKSTIEEMLIKAGLKPYKDGNQWCILVGDNIQEGICGFGDTIDEALYQLLKDVLEQQKEQKPTPVWMPKFLDELRSKKNYFDWDEHRDIEGHILAIINWIAPDYFDRKEKGQKSDTRDADDLQLLGFIYDLLVSLDWRENYAMSKEECLRRLNDYRPQKPAEWSEEDLQHKSWILECLADGEKKMPEYAEDFRAAYKWLKSLRPKSHWKPSEEQMDALADATMRDVFPNGNRERLESLYKDLTKLL